jgi:hypothetical protein
VYWPTRRTTIRSPDTVLGGQRKKRKALSAPLDRFRILAGYVNELLSQIYVFGTKMLHPTDKVHIRR